MASNLSTICRGQSKRSIILSKQRVISINRWASTGHRMQATGGEAGPSIEETCHIHVCQRGPTLRLNLHLVWPDLHPCVLSGPHPLKWMREIGFSQLPHEEKERKNERRKECIESHLTRFSFRERSSPPQFVTVSRYTMRQFQASSLDCATYGFHIRIVRSDRIRSRGSINLNVFILCTRFVDTFSTHAAIRLVHACASMCMLPLPVAHPHPLPVAILRQVV